MIANVQCLLSARLRKTTHVQLVCRHGNIFPIKRTRFGVCFVLNNYSDDPDTSAYMIGQNVPIPSEPVKQTPMTPTASAAVDFEKKGIFDSHALDDNDEPWLSETDQRTGWSK